MDTENKMITYKNFVLIFLLYYHKTKMNLIMISIVDFMRVNTESVEIIVS